MVACALPTMIVWGAKENLFLRDEQDLLTAKISGSALKVYPEAGHSPHWEFPERFAADLNEFFSFPKL